MPNRVCGQDQAVDLRFVGPADSHSVVEACSLGGIAVREESGQSTDLGQSFTDDVAVGECAVPGVVGLVVYRFGVGLFYANAARLSEDVLALVDVPERPRWFVLLADAMDDVDFTGGKTLLELAGQLADRNVAFCIAAGQRVLPELERFGVVDAIGEEHVFVSLDDALAAFHRVESTGDV
jgi:MFS superfamily sulfate permease-like transporter